MPGNREKSNFEAWAVAEFSAHVHARNTESLRKYPKKYKHHQYNGKGFALMTIIRTLKPRPDCEIPSIVIQKAPEY